MAKKLTHEDATTRAKQYAAGKGLTFLGFEDGKYVNAKGRVTLECKNHGLLSMTLDKLTQGTGCRRCGNEAVSRWRTSDISTVTDRIESVCRKRGWGFLGFDGSYIGVEGKACLHCPSHGRFTRRVQDILGDKYGCPGCVALKAREVNRTPEPEAVRIWSNYCAQKKKCCRLSVLNRLMSR